MLIRNSEISKSDKQFIVERLMPLFGVKKLRLAISPSQRKWPDIWVELGTIPKITVTREWMRQGVHERRKRLVHEFLHLRGMGHNESIGYSTLPERDSYSMKMYKRLAKGNPTLQMPTSQETAKFRVTTKLVRSKSYDPSLDIRVTSPTVVVQAISKITKAPTERLMALYLDTKNSIIGIQQISSGEKASSLVPYDHIMRTAILTNASGIILAHNHPSGDPDISEEDVAVTKRLKNAANLVGVEVLDHIVVANGSFQSMKAEGRL